MGIFSKIVRALFGSSEPRRPVGSYRGPQEDREAPPYRPPTFTEDPPPNLDPGDFAPMSREEILKTKAPSASSTALGWVRFDRIPPKGDLHNELVDRAMVSHGFITPEELVEIHEVGAEMDVVQPSVDAVKVRAAAAGRAAAAATQAEREAIKAQKQAEARERRERRARLVEARKKTDIIYLGRGVSQGLADRRANVEKLTGLDLPVLAAPRDIAEAMGLTIPKLRWLAFHAESAKISHYVRFTVPKRTGGVRSLAAPMPLLAATQQWILYKLLSKLETEDPAHGFVRGRSTVTNATPHTGAQVLVNFDLSDFFPTITFPRVRGYFASLGYSPAAATILALLVTEPPRREVVHAGTKYQVATGPHALPQGACTSPALSNLIARQLDRRLHGMAVKLGYEYTRYADDMTFSTKSEEATPSLGYLMARVRHICLDEGFKVNEKKTRVLRPSASQRVTGIVVNDRVNVPRKIIRRMRAILHQAQFTGLEAQNRENHPEFHAEVLGMIAYISMVNPERGAELRAAYANRKL